LRYQGHENNTSAGYLFYAENRPAEMGPPNAIRIFFDEERHAVTEDGAEPCRGDRSSKQTEMVSLRSFPGAINKAEQPMYLVASMCNARVRLRNWRSG